MDEPVPQLSPAVPSSLSLRFAKETSELVVAERERMNGRASELQPLHAELGTISYIMRMTMVDTKVVNVLTGTASQMSSLRPPRDQHRVRPQHPSQLDQGV